MARRRRKKQAAKRRFEFVLYLENERDSQISDFLDQLIWNDDNAGELIKALLFEKLSGGEHMARSATAQDIEKLRADLIEELQKIQFQLRQMRVIEVAQGEGDVARETDRVGDKLRNLNWAGLGAPEREQ